jgi:indole-3-glycerol phosphate synthase
VAVAESGLRTAEELRATRDKGYHAALIGTAFLKGPRRVDDVAAELSSAFEPG